MILLMMYKMTRMTISELPMEQISELTETTRMTISELPREEKRINKLNAKNITAEPTKEEKIEPENKSHKYINQTPQIDG
jgi:hypothetical protein